MALTAAATQMTHYARLVKSMPFQSGVNNRGPLIPFLRFLFSRGIRRAFFDREVLVGANIFQGSDLTAGPTDFYFIDHFIGSQSDQQPGVNERESLSAVVGTFLQ